MATENKPVNIQISRELFLDLVFYFRSRPDLRTPEQEERITQQLNERFDRWYNHTLFGAYRQAESEEQRKKFLTEYLDRTGVSPDFRVLFCQDQQQEPDRPEN